MWVRCLLPQLYDIMRRVEYELNPKQCSECNSDIPFEKRKNQFCGRSCANKHSNKGKFWTQKKCRHCGERPRLGVLCDDCRAKYWDDDPYKRLIFVDKGGHPPREALMQIREYRCEICGQEPTWNGKPLVLHFDHIDGNRKDHRPHNVRWTCPNCHSQTETYAGRNIGRYSGVVQGQNAVL